MAELRWWEVWGSYAIALAAAESEEEAVEMVRTHPGVPDCEWEAGDVADKPVPPASPPAPGVYAWFAE